MYYQGIFYNHLLTIHIYLTYTIYIIWKYKYTENELRFLIFIIVNINVSFNNVLICIICIILNFKHFIWNKIINLSSVFLWYHTICLTTVHWYKLMLDDIRTNHLMDVLCIDGYSKPLNTVHSYAPTFWPLFGNVLMSNSEGSDLKKFVVCSQKTVSYAEMSIRGAFVVLYYRKYNIPTWYLPRYMWHSVRYVW